MSSQRTTDPYDRAPVEGKYDMQNADRYDDPSVDPRATGPGSGFGLAEGQQARETGARLQSSGTTGGPGGLGNQPGQGLPQQTSGGRSAATDAKIAQNAAQGLQSGSGGAGTGGGQRDPYARPPVEGKFEMQNADRYDDPSVDPRATGPGSGFGLATGQQARDTDARLAAQGQGQGQGGQQQSRAGGLGGAQSGLSGQSGQRDPYDRPPVEGKYDMQNADRYDDPSADPRATGPGSGFGLAEGQQARDTASRLAGQGQTR